MSTSALAEQPLPSTPVSMSFAVTPELSPLTMGRGGTTSIPMTPEIADAGSPMLSSRREEFQKRWQHFDAHIEHRLEELSPLFKPSTYYSEPTYATNLPLPHSTSVVPFNVTDDNCLSLDELKRLSRSNKYSVGTQPTRSRQGYLNIDGGSQSKRITLRSAKEIMEADKRTGSKSGDELDQSKHKSNGKTSEEHSDNEPSAVLEILNEIQSVGSSSATNGKSASNGSSKPSGLGLLSTVNEGTPKSSSKVSTPTLPSNNSKRGKTSEKLANAPTPQLGSFDSLSPNIQRKKLSKHADNSSSLAKHSPPKGEIKLNFTLLRSLLKDELHEDWSLPVRQTKAQKSEGAETISPPSIGRNGVKSSKIDNKPGSKTSEKEVPTNRKSSKENMSAISPEGKLTSLPRPVLRIHLALLPDFSPAINTKAEGTSESSKRGRDDIQSGAAKKRKTKEDTHSNRVADMDIEASNSGKTTSVKVDDAMDEVEDGEALSASSSPTVVGCGEKQRVRTESHESPKQTSSRSRTKTQRSSSLSSSPDRRNTGRSKDRSSRSPNRSSAGDRRKQRSRSSERKSKNDARDNRSRSYDRSSKNRRRSSSIVRRRSRTPERHRSHSSARHRSRSRERRSHKSRSRSYDRYSRSGSRDRRRSDSMDKSSDGRRSSLRDKDRRRTQSSRRSRSRDWDQDASENSGSGKSREDSKSMSKSKTKAESSSKKPEQSKSNAKSSSQSAVVDWAKATSAASNSSTSAGKENNVEQYKLSAFMFRELALQYKRRADQSCQNQDEEFVGIAEYLHSIFNYILSYHFNEKIDSAENSFVRWENLQPLLKFVSQTLKRREEWQLYGLCMKVNALINFNAFRLRQTPVRRRMTRLHELLKTQSEAAPAISSEYIPQVEKLLNLHELANVQWDEGEVYFDWQTFRDKFPITWKAVCIEGDFSKGTLFGEEIADMKGPLFPVTPFSKLSHVAVMGKCLVDEWITAHDIDFRPISDPTAV
ncbi:hypothetical protein INT43_006339 [Umbelopsis isabellina]|uniref:Uncharacterized protein n=1 Tax=Mortierella isabellina TaxID=91625 RepID=A0A8H7Q1H7_MORIS|nr:hypothetical protein INT43_006339 [Umbelopsis isabellina]